MNTSTWRQYGGFALIVVMLAMTGSANGQQAVSPPVQLWQIAREVPGADPRWQRVEAEKAGVRVWRRGREIAVRRLMELLPGDEIEIGQNAAAVLRFRDAGDTLVLAARACESARSKCCSDVSSRCFAIDSRYRARRWWPASRARAFCSKSVATARCMSLWPTV